MPAAADACLAEALGDAATSDCWPLTGESLVVLVHGLDGCPEELGCLASFLREACPAHILASKCNLAKTHDGVYEGGARLATDIHSYVLKHAGVLRDITLVGMSLGTFRTMAGNPAAFCVDELRCPPSLIVQHMLMQL